MIAFSNFFVVRSGYLYYGLAALALMVGGFCLHARDRVKFWLLLLPWIFVLSASALHKYPSGGRLALFLVPSAMLFMRERSEQARIATRTQLACSWICAKRASVCRSRCLPCSSLCPAARSGHHTRSRVSGGSQARPRIRPLASGPDGPDLHVSRCPTCLRVLT
jgi:hypothetical protein